MFSFEAGKMLLRGDRVVASVSIDVGSDDVSCACLVGQSHSAGPGVNAVVGDGCGGIVGIESSRRCLNGSGVCNVIALGRCTLVGSSFSDSVYLLGTVRGTSVLSEAHAGAERNSGEEGCHWEC